MVNRRKVRNALNALVKKKNLSMDAIKRLFKKMLVKILLYGSEA